MKTRPLKTIVRLVLSVAALVIVFQVVGGAEILEAMSSVRASGWLAALVGFLLLHAASAGKWRFFLGLAGVRVPYVTALRCYGAGLFANLCLPSLVGGDVVRAGLVMRVAREKEAVVLGSLIDRLCDVAALGLLVCAGMIAAPSAATELHRGAVSGFYVFAAIVIAIFVGGLTGWLVLARLPIRRMPRKVGRFLIEVLRALRAVRSSPLRVTAGIVFCLLLQAGFVVINIGLGRMMGMDLDVRLWFLLWPLAKIAAMLPLSLGGLGVREAAFGLLVKPFIDSRLAVAESLVWQSVLIAGGLIAGAYWLASGLRLGRDRSTETA